MNTPVDDDLLDMQCLQFSKDMAIWKNTRHLYDRDNLLIRAKRMKGMLDNWIEVEEHD